MIDLKKYANVKVIGTLVALVVLFLLWRNGKRWYQQLFKQDRGNYGDVTSQADMVAGKKQNNAARSAELEKYAKDTHAALNSMLLVGGVSFTGREFQLELINALNDSELRYVATFYTSIDNDGNTLKGDIDKQWMPMSDIDEKLIARLNQLAL